MELAPYLMAEASGNGAIPSTALDETYLVDDADVSIVFFSCQASFFSISKNAGHKMLLFNTIRHFHMKYIFTQITINIYYIN